MRFLVFEISDFKITKAHCCRWEHRAMCLFCCRAFGWWHTLRSW